MGTKRFLLWFANDYLNFRIAEIESLCALFAIKPKWVEPITKDKPYTIIEDCTETQVRQIMSRTVLVKWALELWARSADRQDLFAKIKSCDYINLEENCSPDKSFKFLVKGSGVTLSLKDQVDKIEQFDFLPFKGNVDLKNPANVYGLFEHYGICDTYRMAKEPINIFFGRVLAEGQRAVIYKHNLKTRKFISNTSMDPTLSLLMANIAKIKPGDVVLDPFVGSGGLLLAVAHFGGYVLGHDIDYKLLMGLSKPTRPNQKVREADENIYENLRQVDLESKYVDVLVADASRANFRSDLRFDAIVTDPPYGIREKSLQIGSKKEDPSVPEHLLHIHIPEKMHYNLSDIMCDLINFSAQNLEIGGRLCFWQPVLRDDESTLSERDWAAGLMHENFSTLYACEDVMQQLSRLLIVMEKVSEPDLQFGCDELRGTLPVSKANGESALLRDARNFNDAFRAHVGERCYAKRNGNNGKQ